MPRKKQQPPEGMAARIRQLRQERGWTQDELGRRLSIHKAYVSRLENNLGTPSLPLLRKLAEAFTLSVDELIEDLSGGPKKLQDKHLMRLLLRIELLPTEEKKLLVYLMEAVLLRSDAATITGRGRAAG